MTTGIFRHFILTCVGASLLAQAAAAGSCTLTRVCEPASHCSESPLELSWTRDVADKLSVNGMDVAVVWPNHPLLLDKIRSHGKDYEISIRSKAIIFVGKALVGRIYPDLVPGDVIATVSSNAVRRHADEPHPLHRTYSGHCEELL